jgi:hypothetical protein
MITANIATVLPVVLYGRDTWSLTLREEYRTRVFQNLVLRNTLSLKEIRQQERKRSFSGEVYDPYSSLNIIRVIATGKVRRAGI